MVVRKPMPKVSVFGGAGFLGTHLCQILADSNIDFEILDIKPSKRFPEHFKYCDVRDIISVNESLSGTWVVNLAAAHRDDLFDKTDYEKTNVLGAENIAVIAGKTGVELCIFVSTVAVYGFAPPDTDESGIISPFNEYGRTKARAEDIFRKWQKQTNAGLIIVRPTVIFGPGNRGNVFGLFNQIYRRRFLMVGKGQNTKSIAYVENVAAFLAHCLRPQSGWKVVNYVDDPALEMRSLVTKVRRQLLDKDGVGLAVPFALGFLSGMFFDVLARVTGKKFPLSLIRVKKFCATTTFKSNSQLMRNFDRPFVLDQAIEKTIDLEFFSDDKDFEIFLTE